MSGARQPPKTARWRLECSGTGTWLTGTYLARPLAHTHGPCNDPFGLIISCFAGTSSVTHVMSWEPSCGILSGAGYRCPTLSRIPLQFPSPLTRSSRFIFWTTEHQVRGLCQRFLSFVSGSTRTLTPFPLQVVDAYLPKHK